MLEGRRIKLCFLKGEDFSCEAVVKNPSANARDKRDVGLIPGSGRFPGEGVIQKINTSDLFHIKT